MPDAGGGQLQPGAAQRGVQEERDAAPGPGHGAPVHGQVALTLSTVHIAFV